MKVGDKELTWEKWSFWKLCRKT